MRWAGLLLAAPLCAEPKAAAVQPILIQAPAAQREPGPDIGRYHIIEGRPGPLRLAPILLDTANGDTWTVCDVDGVSMWCDMKRGAFQIGKQVKR